MAEETYDDADGDEDSEGGEDHRADGARVTELYKLDLDRHTG